MTLLQMIALGATLSLAVYWDVRSRRIPNALTVTTAGVGFLLFALGGGLHGLILSAQGLLVGFALFILPFAMGGLGGGDVKLAMAIGALTGPETALYVILYGALAGGVIASVILIAHGRFVRTCRGLVQGVWTLATTGTWDAPGLFLGKDDALTEDDAAPSDGSAGAAARQASFPYAVAIAVGALLAVAFAPVTHLPW